MAVFRGFWDTLAPPIIGLSPMDGVTDVAFRTLVHRYSRPSVTITEFTNVEGMARGAVKMLSAFKYGETERPVVAQIFGTEPDSYYKVALLLCSMGFDGIDINMGCPAPNVSSRGAGASLIRTPELAKELVRQAKQAVKDWSEGKNPEDADVPEAMVAAARTLTPGAVPRRRLPVSVKTRIGYDKGVAEEWMKHLLEAEPANISLHGRTLKQMYLGRADWDAIARAAAVVHKSGLPTTLLGNGDIASMEDARKKIGMYGVDGVLVGRAVLGNPWFFKDYEPTPAERARVAMEHSTLFATLLPEYPFVAMRKHLGWYTRGFTHAKDVRIKLMQANSPADVRAAYAEYQLI